MCYCIWWSLAHVIAICVVFRTLSICVGFLLLATYCLFSSGNNIFAKAHVHSLSRTTLSSAFRIMHSCSLEILTHTCRSFTVHVFLSRPVWDAVARKLAAFCLYPVIHYYIYPLIRSRSPTQCLVINHPRLPPLEPPDFRLAPCPMFCSISAHS